MNANSSSSLVIRKPSSFFNTIIEEYVLRTITVKEGTELVKFMPCRYTNSIDFYIGDTYDTIDLKSGELKAFSHCTIRGPRTHKKNKIFIKGNFRCFSIRFTSTGIYQLLDIPMDQFCNEAVDALLVYPEVFRELTERLMGCNDIQSCIFLAEDYLTNKFKPRKSASPIVSNLASKIVASANTVPLTSLYKQMALCTRQLERNFVKEIGLTPKMYGSIVRFEKVMKHKLLHTNKKWTEIAYEHNYADQMHMVKDFHRFLNISPSNFSPEDFAL